MEEDVVMVLDKNVAMVMVLVLALEENVVLDLEEDVVLAMEEDVVCTKNHPARRRYTRGGVHIPWARQRAGGGKCVSKDTNGGGCQRRA